MAPVGALALPGPQDDREGHGQEERECRVYRCTQGYRDARDDDAYHRWLESKHASSVDYDRLDHKRQENIGNGAITMRNTSITKTVALCVGGGGFGLRRRHFEL